MTLALDAIALGVPEVRGAQAFYASASLDLGRSVHAEAVEPGASGFRGYVVSYVVEQPSEVELLLSRAAQVGAEVLKPAKKGLFGGFSGTCRMPDGSIWKLSAPSKKDTGPAADPPVPTETAVLLGVADPVVSKAFYTALGMTVDRDYGSKYLDFHPAPGACRLGLMTRQALAKDVGVDAEGTASRAVVLTRRAGSREEADALLAAAASAGGRITVPGSCFTDPDGFAWQVECSGNRG